jgi:hypothetical protein
MVYGTRALLQLFNANVLKGVSTCTDISNPKEGGGPTEYYMPKLHKIFTGKVVYLHFQTLLNKHMLYNPKCMYSAIEL